MENKNYETVKQMKENVPDEKKTDLSFFEKVYQELLLHIKNS